MKRVLDIFGRDRMAHCGSRNTLRSATKAARSLSCDMKHRDAIVVVVELGSEFDIESGRCLKRQYLYYPFRETTDFHRIVCLKAAFRNGIRVDGKWTPRDRESELLELLSDLSIRANMPSIVWGKPKRIADGSENGRLIARWTIC